MEIFLNHCFQILRCPIREVRKMTEEPTPQEPAPQEPVPESDKPSEEPAPAQN
jgi:hypothetical protein